MFLFKKKTSQPSNPPERGPIVFLDIDGVLNRTRYADHIKFERALVRRLKQVLDATGARVVLSTFWRKFSDYIVYLLGLHGVAARLVVGITPGRGHMTDTPSPYKTRADEIRAWLKANPSVRSFVVLDDRADAGEGNLSAHFVKTDHKTGLSDADAKRAVQILQNGSIKKEKGPAKEMKIDPSTPSQDSTQADSQTGGSSLGSAQPTATQKVRLDVEFVTDTQ